MKMCVKDPYKVSHYIPCAYKLHNLMVARNDTFIAMPVNALPQLPVHDSGDMEGGIELGCTDRDVLHWHRCFLSTLRSPGHKIQGSSGHLPQCNVREGSCANKQADECRKR